MLQDASSMKIHIIFGLPVFVDAKTGFRISTRANTAKKFILIFESIMFIVLVGLAPV